MIQEPPPKESCGSDLSYRRELFDLFLPIEGVKPARKKLNLKRRFILNFYLNGRLDQPEIQHHCVFGCCCDYPQTLRRMAKHCAWALIPTKPPVFARARWTNWDVAIDAIGLLAGTHSLLKDVFFEFIGEKDVQHGVPLPAPAIDETSFDWDGFLEEEVKQNHSTNSTPARVAATAATPREEQQQDQALGGSHRDQAIDHQTANSTNRLTDSFAEFNRQQRLLAKDWVQTKPFPRLCMMKEIAAVLMWLMYHFLKLAGKTWEQQQQFRSSRGYLRSYPVLSAANGVEVEHCIEQLFRILWMKPKCLQGMDFNPLHRALRFKMVSCAVCSMHVLLELPRRGFPVSLFKLLFSDSHAQVLLDTPACLRDGLADAILKEYDSW